MLALLLDGYKAVDQGVSPDGFPYIIAVGDDSAAHQAFFAVRRGHPWFEMSRFHRFPSVPGCEFVYGRRDSDESSLWWYGTSPNRQRATLEEARHQLMMCCLQASLAQKQARRRAILTAKVS